MYLVVFVALCLSIGCSRARPTWCECKLTAIECFEIMKTTFHNNTLFTNIDSDAANVPRSYTNVQTTEFMNSMALNCPPVKSFILLEGVWIPKYYSIVKTRKR